MPGPNFIPITLPQGGPSAPGGQAVRPAGLPLEGAGVSFVDILTSTTAQPGTAAPVAREGSASTEQHLLNFFSKEQLLASGANIGTGDQATVVPTAIGEVPAVTGPSSPPGTAITGALADETLLGSGGALLPGSDGDLTQVLTLSETSDRETKPPLQTAQQPTSTHPLSGQNIGVDQPVTIVPQHVPLNPGTNTADPANTILAKTQNAPTLSAQTVNADNTALATLVAVRPSTAGTGPAKSDAIGTSAPVSADLQSAQTSAQLSDVARNAKVDLDVKTTSAGKPDAAAATDPSAIAAATQTKPQIVKPGAATTATPKSLNADANAQQNGMPPVTADQPNTGQTAGDKANTAAHNKATDHLHRAQTATTPAFTPNQAAAPRSDQPGRIIPGKPKTATGEPVIRNPPAATNNAGTSVPKLSASPALFKPTVQPASASLSQMVGDPFSLKLDQDFDLPGTTLNNQDASNVINRNLSHNQTNQLTRVPINLIAVNIAHHASQGTNRFQVRLDPPELGRVDVKLSVDGDGKVSASLTVERPETLDLLQRDARALERALTDAGLSTDKDSLNFSLKDQGSEGGPQDDGQDGPVQPANTDDDDINMPIHRGYLSATGVDIRV